MNKKGKAEEIGKKRTRKAVKIQKAITGLTLEELKSKRVATKPKVTQVKEHKEKATKDKKSFVPVAQKPAVVAQHKVQTKVQTGGKR
jgi:large subunit ribosomal protein L24e